MARTLHHAQPARNEARNGDARRLYLEGQHVLGQWKNVEDEHLKLPAVVRCRDDSVPGLVRAGHSFLCQMISAHRYFEKKNVDAKEVHLRQAVVQVLTRDVEQKGKREDVDT